MARHRELRWTFASALCLVRDVSLQLAQGTTSTAGVPTFGLFVARGFTASDTGGSAVTLTGNQLKKRAGYPSTLVGDARFGNGAALTAGTRTLDGAPILTSACGLAAGSGSPSGPFPDLRSDPLVLAQDEGLILRNMVAQTAGVTRALLRVEWIEVAAGSL